MSSSTFEGIQSAQSISELSDELDTVVRYSEWKPDSAPVEFSNAAARVLRFWSKRIAPVPGVIVALTVISSAIWRPVVVVAAAVIAMTFAFLATGFLLWSKAVTKAVTTAVKKELVDGLEGPLLAVHHIVRVAIFRDNVCLGTDFGVICFESGWLIFEGKLTRFSISANNAQSTERVWSIRGTGIPSNYTKVLELNSQTDWHHRVAIELISTRKRDGWQAASWETQFDAWLLSEEAEKERAILPPRVPMPTADLLITAQIFNWSRGDCFSSTASIFLFLSFVYFHQYTTAAITFYVGSIALERAFSVFSCARERRKLDRVRKEILPVCKL